MTEDAPSRCLCSHAKITHSRGTGQCWSAACGCSVYRPKPQDGQS